MHKSIRIAIALLLCALFALGSFAAAPQGIPRAAAAETGETEAVPYYLTGSALVYITATGKRYHLTDHCGNTQTAHLVSLEEACRLGFTPCGRCHPFAFVEPDESFTLPEDAVIVYISVGDECYHKTAACCGMEDAVAVTLEEALYLGRDACLKCDPPQ
jgi:hypothetical protein